MKLLSLSLLVAFCFQFPAIADTVRTRSSKVSNLGAINAKNYAQADKLCNKKGGNVLISVKGKRTCYYYRAILRT